MRPAPAARPRRSLAALAPTALAAGLLLAAAALADARLPAATEWTVGGHKVRVEAGAGFAGAISSLKVDGFEYLDAADHGRLLQGAIAFDGLGECFNPTQGGASRDDPGKSHSRPLAVDAASGAFLARTRMAYWKAPGENCAPPAKPERKAANPTEVSTTVYGLRLVPEGRVIRAEAVVETAEPHGAAVVEALTAYMPAAFTRWRLYDPKARAFVDGPATFDEQAQPVIRATADGQQAFGVVAHTPGATYPGYVFPGVSKWSVVYRPEAYEAGPHTYRMVLAVGTLDEVEAALKPFVRR